MLPRVLGILKPGKYAGKHRFPNYRRFHVLNWHWSLVIFIFEILLDGPLIHKKLDTGLKLKTGRKAGYYSPKLHLHRMYHKPDLYFALHQLYISSLGWFHFRSNSELQKKRHHYYLMELLYFEHRRNFAFLALRRIKTHSIRLCQCLKRFFTKVENTVFW